MIVGVRVVHIVFVCMHVCMCECVCMCVYCRMISIGTKDIIVQEVMQYMLICRAEHLQKFCHQLTATNNQQ